MAALRLYVFLFVFCVQLNSIFSKPFFGDMICDYLCDDDDTSTSTSTSTSSSSNDFDFFSFDPTDICSCSTRRPPKNPKPNRGSNIPSSINLTLPASNGVNLSMINNNGQWSFGLVASPLGQGQGGPSGPGGANGPSGPGGPGPSTDAPTTAASVADTTAAAE